MTDRKKPGVAFWVTVVLVAVLVGYPLSLFPIAWLDVRGILLNDNSVAGKITWSYCAPARWAYESGPAWLHNYLEWVWGLGMTKS